MINLFHSNPQLPTDQPFYVQGMSWDEFMLEPEQASAGSDVDLS